MTPVSLFFDEGARAAALHRRRGAGFLYQMQQFQEERLWAAAAVNLNLCIQWTIDYAQGREIFGATIADQQWVQFKLAELKTGGRACGR